MEDLEETNSDGSDVTIEVLQPQPSRKLDRMNGALDVGLKPPLPNLFVHLFVYLKPAVLVHPLSLLAKRSN